MDRLQAQALGQDETSLQTRLAALTLASGAEQVTGPGITVVLDNAPGSDGTSADGNPRTDADKDEGTVFSKDLQIVVNGLWEAGAEAIAVNGQRLTSRSAIRFAGEAILVNYRPLARPYRDQRHRRPRGPAGRVRRQRRRRLRARPAGQLRHPCFH